MSDVDAAVQAARAAEARDRADLEELVRIVSISSSASHVAQVRESADATAALLERSGLEHVRIADAGGVSPCVIGDWLNAGPDASTVLLYAHHDVQPPGVVERWSSDPFEPVERDGRLYGRGTADDKAGVVAHAAAIAAWLQSAGTVPCNVRILVEGEEEIGSPHLGEFLEANVGDLRSDVLVLADADNWDVGVPGITYSLRGLACADVTLRALDGPVHSGTGGGGIPDPVLGLARVLATLVDDNGEIAIDGVWDDVIAPSPAVRRRIDALPDNTGEFRRALGVRPGVELVGDATVALHERLWQRPAVTIIGIDGHPVSGSSNQIVASATARVSLRLAPGQDPTRVLESLRAHIERRVSWGLEWTVVETEAGSAAWLCEPSGPAFDAAERALTEGFGVAPVLMGSGGSIPFVGPFAAAFGGIPALLLAPSDPASAIHGENESLHLATWCSLVESEVRLLSYLA